MKPVKLPLTAQDRALLWAMLVTEQRSQGAGVPQQADGWWLVQYLWRAMARDRTRARRQLACQLALLNAQEQALLVQSVLGRCSENIPENK